MGGGQPAPPQEQTNAAVSGGLGALLQRFQQSGYGDIVNSWIGTGQNQPIAPDQLHEAIGPETVDELSRQTGVPREEVLSELSQALPHDGRSVHAQGPDPKSRRNGALATALVPGSSNNSCCA